LTFWAGVGAFRNGPAPDLAANVWGYSGGGGAGWAFTPEIELRGSAQRLVQETNADQNILGLNRDILAVQLAWTPLLAPKGI
jgi:hypothetical protein